MQKNMKNITITSFSRVVTLILLLSIIVVVKCHGSGHKNDDDDDEDDDVGDQNHNQLSIGDLRYLFLKYSNFTHGNSMSIRQTSDFIEHFYNILSDNSSARNETKSNEFDCYTRQINNFTERFNKLNKTKHIDERKFSKLSAFLVFNLDWCYNNFNKSTDDEFFLSLDNRTRGNQIEQREKYFYHEILENVVHLKKEGTFNLE